MVKGNIVFRYVLLLVPSYWELDNSKEHNDALNYYSSISKSASGQSHVMNYTVYCLDSHKYCGRSSLEA